MCLLCKNKGEEESQVCCLRLQVYLLCSLFEINSLSLFQGSYGSEVCNYEKLSLGKIAWVSEGDLFPTI